MSERYRFGELKESDAVPLYVKIPKKVKESLAKMKGERSWGKFLADLAKQ
jgi:hypothetical protein